MCCHTVFTHLWMRTLLLCPQLCVFWSFCSVEQIEAVTHHPVGPSVQVLGTQEAHGRGVYIATRFLAGGGRVAVLFLGRGTDLETTSGLQAYLPCVRRGDLSGLCDCPGAAQDPLAAWALLHLVKSKLLSEGPRPFPLLRLW